MKLRLALVVLLLAAPSSAQSPRDQYLLAGHLLRRLGFGPNRREMHEVLRLGHAAYIEQQLEPESIDDRVGERRFHPEPPTETTTATCGSSAGSPAWPTRAASCRRR